MLLLAKRVLEDEGRRRPYQRGDRDRTSTTTSEAGWVDRASVEIRREIGLLCVHMI